MEKLIDILSKILASVQVVFNGVLSLIFQPLFYLISIIQGIVDVWSEEEEEFEPEQPQQNVTEYPSTNAGRPYPEECDPPVCEHKIGYRINHQEQEELDKIKKELKNGK